MWFENAMGEYCEEIEFLFMQKMKRISAFELVYPW